MEILLLRHSSKNYQIWLYKLNLMCEELPYQLINTSAVNQAVFCKNYYKKVNISVDCSDHRRDALFWIHLRQTWLNLFGLILAAVSFSTLIFSTGIKLFIQHPVVLFDILILLEQVNDFVQLPPWCILKDRLLCLHKYLKYWILYHIIA